MSIVSALFAPAVPVSTGMPTAASGAEANNAGLFSSRVALMLDANLIVAAGEAGTAPSRPAVFAPLNLSQPHGLPPANSAPVDTPVDAEATVDSAAQSSLETALPLVSAGDTGDVKEQSVSQETATTNLDTPIQTPLPTPQAPPAQQATVDEQTSDQDAAANALQPEATRQLVEGNETASPIGATPRQVEPSAGVRNKAPAVDEAAVEVVAASSDSATSQADAIAQSAQMPIDTPAAAARPIDIAPKIAAAGNSSLAGGDPLETAPAVGPTAMIDAATKSEHQRLPQETTELPVAQTEAKAAPRPLASPNVAETATPSLKADVSAAPSAAKTAAASPIAQLLADAQIAASQVQVAVSAPPSSPASIITPDVASALAAIEPSERTATASSDLSVETSDADKTTTPAQTAPPLKAARHELAQQTTNAATASSPSQPEANSVVAPPSRQTADVAPAASAIAPLKVADLAAGTAVAEISAAADGAPAAAAPSDTQTVQHAAEAGRDLGLSTLSRATVETTAQLAAQIARRLDGRSTRFDMVLTPEDLGRVDVQLEIGKDGQLSARLAFDNPAAAAELRGRADELRRQLQDAGFQVAGDALDFSQRDPSAGNGGGFDRQQQRNALFASGARLADLADAPHAPAPGVWINHSQTPDRVDLKV